MSCWPTARNWKGGDLEAADKDGITVSELLATWQEGHSAPMWVSKKKNK